MPGTTVLRNKAGVDTQQELDQLEANATAYAEPMLRIDPPANTGDLRQLCEIHARLFGAVYEWAGKIRTVDLYKEHDASHSFTPWNRIVHDMGEESRLLHSESLLAGMDEATFITRLTYHFAQVNRIHPFREGNGRVQRLFWTFIAADAGHPLDWSHVNGQWMRRASAKSMDNDLDDLHDLIARTVQDGANAQVTMFGLSQHLSE